MSETSTSTDLAEREARSRELAHHPEQLPMLPGEVRPHPSPAQYVLIAVVLVVVTALEVGASYLEGDMNSNLLIVVLLAFGVIKFFLVAAWYMHLRTDIPFFSRVFSVGLVAAGVLYLIVLLTFSVFD
jgi:cytochrome c oxidase subunit 4